MEREDSTGTTLMWDCSFRSFIRSFVCLFVRSLLAECLQEARYCLSQDVEVNRTGGWRAPWLGEPPGLGSQLRHLLAG